MRSAIESEAAEARLLDLLNRDTSEMSVEEEVSDYLETQAALRAWVEASDRAPDATPQLKAVYATILARQDQDTAAGAALIRSRGSTFN